MDLADDNDNDDDDELVYDFTTKSLQSTYHVWCLTGTHSVKKMALDH